MSHNPSALPQGWYSRAVAHPFARTFTPSRSTLLFAILRSAPADPGGLTAAFFAPDVVVDSEGRVLKIAADDFTALESLARSAVDENLVPQTSRWRNRWTIYHPTTCWPNDELRVIVEGSGQEKVVSVYGFDGTTTKLTERVGQERHLHPILLTAFKILKEPRAKTYRVGGGNPEVLSQVKAVLPYMN